MEETDAFLSALENRLWEFNKAIYIREVQMYHKLNYPIKVP